MPDAPQPGSLPGDRRLVRALALAASGLALLYGAMCLALPNLPWNDVPNHAARGLVMADLLFGAGARWGALFELRLGWEPYLLGDLVLAALNLLLAPDVAARVLVAASTLALPAAVLLFLRTTTLDARAVALVALVALASLVVATDNTWALGFTNFRLGLALMFIALWAGSRFLERGGAARGIAWAGLVAAGELMHLATPLLLATSIGALALARWPWSRPQLARIALLGAAPVAAFAWGALSGSGAADGGGSPYAWAPLAEKLKGAYWLLARYETAANEDRIVTLLFALALLPGLLRVATLWSSRDTRGALLAAAANGALYLALPTSQGMIYGIDARALPPLYLFAAIASFGALTTMRARAAAGTARADPRVLAAAIAMTGCAGLNLGHVWTQLRTIDARIGEVRATLAALPERSRVLPIVTRIARGSMILHAASFAVVDRAALTPYLFSGDQGHPQAYFRYRDRPPAPAETWFIERAPVDRGALQRDWPWLLVVGPAEGVAQVDGLRRVRSTRTATLYGREEAR